MSVLKFQELRIKPKLPNGRIITDYGIENLWRYLLMSLIYKIPYYKKLLAKSVSLYNRIEMMRNSMVQKEKALNLLEMDLINASGFGSKYGYHDEIMEFETALEYHKEILRGEGGGTSISANLF